MALSRFRQAKSADEEAKNKWRYGFFEQCQKQRLIKGCQVISLMSHFTNGQFVHNRSRFANVFGSFALVPFASNRSRASM